MKKRIMSIFLALSMMVGLGACSSNKEKETIPYTFDEVLTLFSDTTNLDELMEVALPLYIAYDEIEKVDFSDAVNELEDRLKLSQELKAANIRTDKDKETEEDFQGQYSDLSFDEARLLLESLEKDDLTDIEKERIKNGLALLATENKNWIEKNGLKISRSLLWDAIKASLCEATGLEIDYYSFWTINQRTDNNNNQEILARVNDPVSREEMTYKIDNSSSLNILNSALERLHEMEHREPPLYETIESDCLDALEYCKLIASTGIELTDQKMVTTTLSPKEAKKLILEKSASSTTEKED